MKNPGDPPHPRPARRQLNLRLEPDAAEILEAVAFLQGKASIQEVVMPLIDEYVEARRDDPQVRAALEQRSAFQERAQEPLWRNGSGATE